MRKPSKTVIRDRRPKERKVAAFIIKQDAKYRKQCEQKTVTPQSCKKISFLRFNAEIGAVRLPIEHRTFALFPICDARREGWR
jgi:hypothetical protein